MIKSKVCKNCNNSFPAHFFKDDNCVPCTIAIEEARKKKHTEPSKEQTQTYYTEEEPVCTSCNG